MAPLAVWTRYPWLCGYLAAPGAYHVVSQVAPCYKWATPLLAGMAAPAPLLAFGWHFHFLRRAAEVVFLNVYHGKGIPDERDSVIEFVYYTVWGIINGCTAACLKSSDSAKSLKDSPLAIFGLALFGLAQAGNFYCHAHLRSLRPDPKDTNWVIPQKFPFSILVAPHYTFEVLGWVGFALASGLAPPSILINLLTFGILSDCAQKRKEKYMKMYKQGGPKIEGPSPDRRWLLIPFIY